MSFDQVFLNYGFDFDLDIRSECRLGSRIEASRIPFKFPANSPKVYLILNHAFGFQNYKDERVIRVFASGLTPGNFLIEASLITLNISLEKPKTAITTKEMELFSLITSTFRIQKIQTVKVTVTIYASKPPMVDCELFKTLGKFLDDSQFSDFKFIVKNQKFKVHRNILSAASPIFQKIFTVDMEEAKNSECIIEDIEPEIFEHLLRFIYKREVPEELAEVAIKLFETAHYYEIGELKTICLMKVFPLINSSNAVEIFNWACLYDCEELKGKAWIIVKRDILEYSKPFKNEPPTKEVLQKMFEQKEQNDAFWALF